MGRRQRGGVEISRNASHLTCAMKRLMDAVLDSLAAALEASGGYRVLRRLGPQDQFAAGTPANPFTGIILDTETTGMTPGADEVIELGMLKFEYGQDGQIYRGLG